MAFLVLDGTLAFLSDCKIKEKNVKAIKIVGRGAWEKMMGHLIEKMLHSSWSSLQFSSAHFCVSTVEKKEGWFPPKSVWERVLGVTRFFILSVNEVEGNPSEH